MIKHGQVLEDRVHAARAIYDDEAAKELQIWTEVSRPLRTGKLTLEEYTEFVESRVKGRCPRIAKLINGLLRATPTEASV